MAHDLDPCKQNCIAKANDILFTDMTAASDGLSCIHAGSQSLGVCAAGQCIPIDCNFTLNEYSIRDRCGVWCGDGSTCVSVAGSYTHANQNAIGKCVGLARPQVCPDLNRSFGFKSEAAI